MVVARKAREDTVRGGCVASVSVDVDSVRFLYMYPKFVSKDRKQNKACLL